MLDTPHFQVVFTLPAQLRPLARSHPRLVYDLMCRCAASVLQDLAAQRLGARLGITAVLHTWTRELTYHPHVHFLVTAGGLSLDTERWVPTRQDYLFPIRVLGAMFRGRLLEALLTALDRGELDDANIPSVRATVRKLAKLQPRWIVHVEPPRGRPVAAVTKYLARYVKRVAISDARIVAVTDTTVTFHARRGPLTLEGHEFVRRFLLHVLPKGLRKIRHYGLYAPGAAAALATARALLPTPARAEDQSTAELSDTITARSWQVCPACGQHPLRHLFQRPVTSLPPRGPP